MRVPDDFSKSDNVEIGVEFKSATLGNLESSIDPAKLKPTAPPLRDFYNKFLSKIPKSKDDAIIKAYDDFETCYDNSPYFLNNYARILVTAKNERLRNPGKAIKLAEKAMALSLGRDGNCYDTLAIAYYLNGQLDRAIATINVAELLVPGDKKIASRAAQYRKELK